MNSSKLFFPRCQAKKSARRMTSGNCARRPIFLQIFLQISLVDICSLDAMISTFTEAAFCGGTRIADAVTSATLRPSFWNASLSARASAGVSLLVFARLYSAPWLPTNVSRDCGPLCDGWREWRGPSPCGTAAARACPSRPKQLLDNHGA